MNDKNYNIDPDTLKAIKEIREWNDEHYAKTGKRRLGLIRTYGCQMNYLRPI